MTTQNNFGAKFLYLRSNQRLRECDYLDGQRKLAQLFDLLGRICNHHEALRYRGDHLLSQERAAAAFNQVQLGINFVRAVNVDVNFWMGLESGQRNTKLLGQFFSRLRRRNSQYLQALANALRQESDEISCG